ncbi:endonuclease domain-containing protein [Streptomyces sp. NRRL B-24720]|uniref:endonuclease domain-containing protein n=1 Tax=Streptomyces sp. NRRL B-24720 TaxID=1476876 RepID=UPI0004C6D4AC|nr:endonuclease domain-containing protein [Streptomyces sp. NRRL B-24720]
MISQKLAARYLADETRDCPIPMAPEHFVRKRFTEHDFVYFGHVGVRAYKHTNRWRFNEPEVRSAGRTIAALPWDPEDLVDPWPGARAQADAGGTSWRALILNVIRMAADAACKENGCSHGTPACRGGADGWSLPCGLIPVGLLQRYSCYPIACTLPIPTLVWSDETWLIPRTLSVILDRWEESETRLRTAVQACDGCCGTYSSDSSWRTPTAGGWKVLCPVCAAASLRSYRQELAGVTYARVRGKGPRVADYLCAVCDPPRPAAAWDHCHEHGLIRGPLCGSCNTMEGQGKEFLSRKGSVRHLLRCNDCRRSRTMPVHHRLAALRRHLHNEHGVQDCDWPMHFCVSVVESDSGYECRIRCPGQRSGYSDIRLSASETESILSRVMNEEWP